MYNDIEVRIEDFIHTTQADPFEEPTHSS